MNVTHNASSHVHLLHSLAFTMDYTTTEETVLDGWQQWLQHPERLRWREFVFQVHFWAGAIVSPYVLLMSLSGAAIVFRNEASGRLSLEWLVRFHRELLLGEVGRIVNGAGGVCATLLCLTGAIIWWPGIKHWKRSLTSCTGGLPALQRRKPGRPDYRPVVKCRLRNQDVPHHS